MIAAKEQPQIAVDPPSSDELIWHMLDVDQTAAALTVDPGPGLSAAAVEARQAAHGPNELQEAAGTNPLLLLWEQLTDPLVIILIGAAVVSTFLGDAKSVIAISAIVILNAMLGVSQEYRAERAMAALKKLAAPSVRVRRAGVDQDLPAVELVPGDVILLEAGSIVPADARVIDSVNLQVQEAALTGESLAVEKHIRPLENANVPLGDRRNMLYMSTAVTYGRGTALVTATGMKTELGRIAQLIQETETEKTPLQRRMAELARVLFFIAIGIVVLGVIVGLVTLPVGQTITQALPEVFLGAVAMAVAVVPEGLPAVVTIALALGAQRMLRRRALIRKLPAVETLGSVTTICSDKTGTLTENKMTVTVIDVADYTNNIEQVLVSGTSFYSDDINAPQNTAQALLLTSAALCNDATLNTPSGNGTSDLTYNGDPTEGAMLVAAAHFGLWKDRLAQDLPRVAEVPFDSTRKRMTTIHRIDRQPTIAGIDMAYLPANLSGTPYVAFTKGAVDGLLEICTGVFADVRVQPMSDDWVRRITAQNDHLASEGLRVLGVAYRPLPALPSSDDTIAVENELIFLGMIGIIDPPRAEVRDAVAECRTAGIRPVMITGDHPLTALNIAKRLHITDDDKILTGRELDELSPEQLEKAVQEVSVYARVSPEHKLNIVQALQNRNHIVAMTGDGVNDAPALKRADIGVAMGITGTPVSKEASEMVILDDNFATIVSAAEEGRTIYDNVRKFVKYILGSNTGEVGVLFLTQLFGLPLPLNALQILWMNLVTDGLPALALSVEPGEPGNMKRPPHDPQESIFSRGLGGYLVRIGFLIGVLGMAVALIFPYGTTDADHAVWSTMIFTTLVFSQMGHALAIRSERESIFKIGFFTNRAMLGAVALTIGLQIALIYVPALRDFFGVAQLTLGQFLICASLSLVTFAGVELEKWFFQRRGKNRA